MSTNLIVKSNIKNVAGDLNISSDFSEQLNEEIHKLIQKACERAKANNRNTVMGRDL
mgnify:CR=1 FL=1